MRPEQKSIIRFESSWSAVCRLRITGTDALELVGDLLGVVEVAGDDEVDLEVAVAVVDRAQRARPAGGDRLVVGEDVVDLVAAGAA